jgi:hypothetical protein
VKYRKKPVVIDAVQVTERMAFGDQSLPEGVKYLNPTAEMGAPILLLGTLEGTMRGHIGDWVITGVAGEKYFCQDAIFKQTYELEEGQDGGPKDLP